MSTEDSRISMLVVLACLASLLTIASVIGFALSRNARSASARATVVNLNERIRAWWIMVAVLGVAFLLGPLVTLGVFALSSWAAWREYARATGLQTRLHGLHPAAVAALVASQYSLIAISWYGLYAIFIPVYALLLVLAMSAAAGRIDGYLDHVARTHVGLMLCVYCISHAPALLLLDIPDYSVHDNSANALLMFHLLLVVQLSDVLQYVFGKLLGKTPLAPELSPSKTIEGLLWGGLSAVLIGALLHGLTPFNVWQGAAMSALVVIGGALGGLSMSAIKRQMSIKDWGSSIQGHGGVLDRMDSVLFAAPLYFH
jgi:phosphatidate cytidylyltransferase